MLNTAWDWLAFPADACRALSSQCRGEPLVLAFLVPHKRADHSITDHKADAMNLKKRREER